MFWLVPAAGNELRQSPPPGQASPLSCSPTPQPRSPRGLLVRSPGPRPGKGWRLRPWGPGCQGGPAPGLTPARSPSVVICTARGPSLPPSLVQARPQGRLLANQVSPLASAQSGDSGQSQGQGGPLPQAYVLPRGQGPLSQGLVEPSWLCRCATTHNQEQTQDRRTAGCF